MGINLGAALGPLVCSALGEKINWHYGFGAAGIGMVLGLIQFRLTARHLGEAGKHPEPTGTLRRDMLLFVGGLMLIGLLTALGLSGAISLDPVILARRSTSVILGLAAVYFAGLFLFGGLSVVERQRLVVIAVLFLASAMFWAGFEQAGSSLNLFADRFTERMLGGFEVPAGWFQIFNPVFIITLAPVVALVWVALGKRGRNPSLPVKFALGLVLLGGGFLVMAVAARLALAGDRVLPTWLITTYLLHSVGELCLSPVGLSSVTKLAPARLVGQMMGLWFLASSLGNLIAGLVAGAVSGVAEAEMSGRFFQVMLATCGGGLLLLVFARPIKKLMAGVE
jgi:POT family proton-dependent oligopeptide transporter